MTALCLDNKLPLLTLDGFWVQGLASISEAFRINRRDPKNLQSQLERFQQVDRQLLVAASEPACLDQVKLQPPLHGVGVGMVDYRSLTSMILKP